MTLRLVVSPDGERVADLSAMSRTPLSSEGEAAKAAADALYEIAARLPLDYELRGELLQVSGGYRALARSRGVPCRVGGVV